MYTDVELIDAINEIKSGKHTIQNCEKLAAIYTVLDHLYPLPQMKEDRGYSNDSAVNAEVIGLYGDSDFLKLINGKPSKEVWLIVDELIDALHVLNPRLLSNFLDKIQDV